MSARAKRAVGGFCAVSGGQEPGVGAASEKNRMFFENEPTDSFALANMASVYHLHLELLVAKYP